ncbi:hypothetical protein [Arthrobacter castelli]|uniref:hypothetical protein n=1 Tax=Arthrobacter castelli TaxID=271431 RepID=UPI0012DDA592|nr:hypothetical protein [Arthrobacter castelli]
MMEKIEQCILHIGTEKTGSTSIQEFLFRNRNELLQRGYLYPGALTGARHRPNHVALPTYAQNNAKMDGLRRSAGIRSSHDIDKYRAVIEQSLEEEVRSTKGVRVLVLSNEHCSSRLMEVAEVERLISLLKQFVQSISVIVYLRRQDEMALSVYSTQIKAGKPGGDPFVNAQNRGEFYNHDILLTRWEQVVGGENITVRTFDRSRMIGKDVIGDFLATTGIRGNGLVRGRVKNQSMSARGMRITERLNPYFPPRFGRRRNPFRSLLLRVVGLRCLGPGPAMDSEAAERFYCQFQESNDAVRSRYFPDRPSLF